MIPINNFALSRQSFFLSHRKSLRDSKGRFKSLLNASEKDFHKILNEIVKKHVELKMNS